MPEPVLVSIAAAAASRAVAGLYNLIRNKFADDPAATAILDAVEGAAEGSHQIKELGTALEHAEAKDPEFAAQLRDMWHHANVEQHTEAGGVANQASGTVHGNLVQARDISGGIHL